MMLHRSILSKSFICSQLARSYATTDIDSKKIQFTKNSSPSTKPPNEELVFGRTMSDHMLEIDWVRGEGWKAPQIKPFAPFSLEPSALVFHYAMECFEGMKAYLDADGKVRLFRPMDNMNRFYDSATRISLPGFNKEELFSCIKEFVKYERDWIPKGKGYSLYLRPTMIATQAALGVQASSKAKLFVISCPVGPYYKSGFKPVKLLADDKHVRAWPGGVGAHKVGGNYAPGILLQQQAAERGYAQILWLFGKEQYLTEVGTMNLFVYLKNAKGETELVTPPLDGLILPGVTRASVIDLAKQWGENVQERSMTMSELITALNENRVLEVFGAGTACIISPVNGVHYQGKDYDIPLDPKNPTAGAGPLATKLNNGILSIQYGETTSPWSVVVD